MGNRTTFLPCTWLTWPASGKSLIIGIEPRWHGYVEQVIMYMKNVKAPCESPNFLRVFCASVHMHAYWCWGMCNYLLGPLTFWRGLQANGGRRPVACYL